MILHSWELTWKPKRGPIKTTVPLKWGYMGFHVSLGECNISSLSDNHYPNMSHKFHLETGLRVMTAGYFTIATKTDENFFLFCSHASAVFDPQQGRPHGAFPAAILNPQPYTPKPQALNSTVISLHPCLSSPKP